MESNIQNNRLQQFVRDHNLKIFIDEKSDNDIFINIDNTPSLQIKNGNYISPTNKTMMTQTKNICYIYNDYSIMKQI
jgi:hypothetical protein